MATARAFAIWPDDMLFNEVPSALDPQLVCEVLETRRMLSYEGMTMIVVTHERRSAREVSDRVAIFREGPIHKRDTPEQIYESPQRAETADFLRWVL